MTIPKKRVRAWTPKVRTGCRTCRQRRVKCDEARPVCSRCQRAGFVCKGYMYDDHGAHAASGTSPPFISSRSSSTASTEPILRLVTPLPICIVSLTAQECSAVEFFQLQTIAVLPGSTWSVSWERIIYQIALTYNEPGLVHSLAALGAIDRADALFSEGLLIEGREQQRLALLQSNKAMQYISRHIRTKQGEESERQIEVTLLAALLFFSFEMLQGQYVRAWMHLRTGQRILSERCKESTSSTLQNTIDYNDVKHVIMLRSMSRSTMDILAQSFLRLRSDPVLSQDNDEPPTPVCCEPMPSFFGSLEEALVHFDCLVAHCYDVDDELTLFARQQLTADGGLMGANASEYTKDMLESAFSRVVPLDACPELMSSITDLRRDILAWMSALRLSHSNAHESVPYLLAQMESLYLHVRAETCRDANEMLIDRFQPCFKRILALGEQILDSQLRAVAARLPKSGTKISFALGTRLLQVMGFLIGRCRDSFVRKRGLELIRRIEVRGIFNNRRFADCMEFVVGIEERSARPTTCIAPRRDLKAADIPEHARLLSVSVFPIAQTTKKSNEVAQIVWVTGRCDQPSTLEVHEYTMQEPFGDSDA